MNKYSDLEVNLMNSILNFKIKQIPVETRFWMIRTQKGYFYHEFISEKFVALAWNSITSETSFSSSNIETLNTLIRKEYPEIKRPTFVVNKCKSFIHDIKQDDILIIPSDGSQFITFAYANGYYEDKSKTLEEENMVIHSIEHNEAHINEVRCPYRKRMHIIPIRTVRSSEINYHLYKAISSYHGLSNLDKYGSIILNHLFNYYTFKDYTRLVFHVNKSDPITSKELSGFLYSVNSILSSTGIDEMSLSAQASVQSPGDIVFTIKEIYKWFSDNYLFLIAIVAILGGGKFLTVQLPGIPRIIKDILSIKTTYEKEKAEVTQLELNNIEKKIEIKQRMLDLNISPEELASSLETLATCSESMQVQPIETLLETSTIENLEKLPSDDKEKPL